MNELSRLGDVEDRREVDVDSELAPAPPPVASPSPAAARRAGARELGRRDVRRQLRQALDLAALLVDRDHRRRHLAGPGGGVRAWRSRPPAPRGRFPRPGNRITPAISPRRTRPRRSSVAVDSIRTTSFCPTSSAGVVGDLLRARGRLSCGFRARRRSSAHRPSRRTAITAPTATTPTATGAQERKPALPGHRRAFGGPSCCAVLAGVERHRRAARRSVAAGDGQAAHRREPGSTPRRPPRRSRAAGSPTGARPARGTASISEPTRLRTR